MSNPKTDSLSPQSYACPRAWLIAQQLAEQQRLIRQRQCQARVQAANDAVSDYIRQSGTKDYGTAFAHVKRTRPELFAGGQTAVGAAAVANANPNHDKLGRFTFSGDTEAEGGKNNPTDERRGGTPNPASIRGHAYASGKFQTCVADSILSLIAAKHPGSVPSEADIMAQLVAASKEIFTDPRERINWNKEGVRTSVDHYGPLVQKILANNGVQSTAQPGYSSMQQLSDAVKNSGQPAVIGVKREGESDDHAVAVQWDPGAASGEGRFLINNIDANGRTDYFTQKKNSKRGL